MRIYITHDFWHKMREMKEGGEFLFERVHFCSNDKKAYNVMSFDENTII